MARIELKNVSHSYTLDVKEGHPSESEILKQCVIHGLDLVWEDGTANAMLGPSGCGKTTLLNIISGLLAPTFGTVEIDGRDVTVKSPRERRIAQIFQFPVVYDTMSVFGNLAFPLQNEGVEKSVIRDRVEEIAEILELSDLLKYSAGKISQAEKQKVSLGRGIVRKDTAAILLDEPLTVIDPKEKYTLRRKLREVQRKLKITMIYVTHDQHEALTFADYVTVIKDGRVIQEGTPEELHSEPTSPFIGYFIGSPGMNLLECTRKDETLDFGEFTYKLSPEMRKAASEAGARLEFGIRPEFVETSVTEKADWPALNVEVVENMGSYQILTLRSNGIRIKARAPEDMRVSARERVWINFSRENVKLFSEEKRIY